MSVAAKRTLFGSVVFCALTIVGVHYGQIQESENMYQGVVKDEARRQARLAELSASPSSAPRASAWSTSSTPAGGAAPLSASAPAGLSPTQKAAVDGWVPPADVKTGVDGEKERLKLERLLDFERSQVREAKLKAEQSLV